MKQAEAMDQQEAAEAEKKDTTNKCLNAESDTRSTVASLHDNIVDLLFFFAPLSDMASMVHTLHKLFAKIYGY